MTGHIPEAVERFVMATLSKVPQRLIASDGQKPRSEGGPVPKRVQPLISGYECLLGDILGGVMIAQHPHSNCADRVLVPPHEVREGFPFAGQHCRNKLTITSHARAVSPEATGLFQTGTAL